MLVEPGGYAAKVNLCAKPKLTVSLPNGVDGVPVHVEVVGSIRKR